MNEYKRLGDYIQEIDVRNRDLSVTKLLGLSMTKQFRPSTSNIIGVDLSKYKIVGKNVFAFDTMSVIRVHKVPIAINNTDSPIIVSPAYVTFECKNNNELDPQYLMMWFMRNEFDRYADFKSDAAVRGGYDWDELCDTSIYIPPIEQQREIVAEYETLSKRISLNEQMISKLEQTAQTLYRKMFVEGIDKENLPEGWRMGMIGDITEIKNGKAITSSEGYTPIYGGNGIVGYTNKPNAKDIVVIGRVGINCGSLFLHQGECFVNDNAMIATSKGENSVYLYLTLKQVNWNIQSEGSSQPLLTQSIITEHKIIVPNIKQIKEFEIEGRILYKNKQLLEQENEKLTELQSLLLARMGR